MKRFFTFSEVQKLTLTFSLFFLLSNAQSPPDLRCVSVEVNGTVIFNWAAPAQITGFSNYTIWRDGTQLDSISNPFVTSYHDNTINANFASHCYIVEARYNNGQYFNSNQLCSIYLTVTSPTISCCQLSWTPLPLQPSSGFYQVYRDVSGFSTIIADTTVLNYIDSSIIGPITAYYQIKVFDNSGCISKSNESAGCAVTIKKDLSQIDCKVKCSFNSFTNLLDFESPCINDRQIYIELFNTRGQLTYTTVASKNISGKFFIQKSLVSKGLNLFLIKTQDRVYSGKIIVP